MTTAKSCCFIQDKNIDMNNKTAKRKATWLLAKLTILPLRKWLLPTNVTCVIVWAVFPKVKFPGGNFHGYVKKKKKKLPFASFKS